MPRLTQRDRAALEWLEDMRAISEPDLGALLGRLQEAGAAPPGRERQAVDRLSASATRTVVRRWENAGVARAQKVFAHEPRYVWLTLDGARLAGAEHWREPGWGVLEHTSMVARARLVLERTGTPVRVAEWVSERRIRQERQAAIKAGAHVPDAEVIEPDGTRCAIEVELSDKGPGRTLPIVTQLVATYPRTVYVVRAESQTARTVRGALREALEQEQARGARLGRIAVVDLPEEV